MSQIVSLLVSLAVSRIGCNPFGNRGSAVSLAVSLAVSESVLSAVPQRARKAVRRQRGKPFGGVWRQRGKPFGGSWQQRGKPFGGVWRQRGKPFGGSLESAWGRGGWRWLAVNASRLFAALAGGSLAHALGRPPKPAEPRKKSKGALCSWLAALAARNNQPNLEKRAER